MTAARLWRHEPGSYVKIRRGTEWFWFQVVITTGEFASTLVVSPTTGEASPAQGEDIILIADEVIYEVQHGELIAIGGPAE